jgi:hypothetical protein
MMDPRRLGVSRSGAPRVADLELVPVFETVHGVVGKAEMMAYLVNEDVGHEIVEANAGRAPFQQEGLAEQRDDRRHFPGIPD